MKKTYEKPIVEIDLIDEEDILTASNVNTFGGPLGGDRFVEW